MIHGADDLWFKENERWCFQVWRLLLAIGVATLAFGGIISLAYAQTPVPNVVGSQYLTAPLTVTNQQLVPFQVDSHGVLAVNATVAAGGTVTANQGTAAAVGSAWPVTLAIGGALNAIGNPIFTQLTTGSATIGALTANQSVNLAQVAGATTATGNGTAAGSVRVALPTDGTGVVGLNTGTNTIGGTIPKAGTTGGATASFLQPTASDNHATIKNGAGTLYGAVGFNNSVTVNYLRYYDLGTGFNGCNSATGLLAQFQIPPSGGFSIQMPVGMNFGTGLSICVTSGYATTDTTNATASAMSLTTLYN